MAVSFAPSPRSSLRKTNTRSEEHTSELQSRLHLVCRLLLEKKKRRLLSRESSRIPHPLRPSSRNTPILSPAAASGPQPLAPVQLYALLQRFLSGHIALANLD